MSRKRPSIIILLAVLLGTILLALLAYSDDVTTVNHFSLFQTTKGVLKPVPTEANGDAQIVPDPEIGTKDDQEIENVTRTRTVSPGQTSFMHTTNHPGRSDNIIGNGSSTGLRGCPLPKVNPYDPALDGYVDWKFVEKYRKCDKNFQMRSSYKKGRLEVKRNGEKCKARCFEQVSYHHRNQAQSWTELSSDSTPFSCEFIEVVCAASNTNRSKENPSYAMLHSDFKKKIDVPKFKPTSQVKHHDVYVFVLDSVGNSAADRTLPKTMRFLEKSFEAVRFPFVNKVGQNSRPNALAWFLGKQIEPIDRLGLGLPSIPEDWEWEASCHRYMDNESSIFQDYRKEGYVTLLTDDWSSAVLNYPNCKGWKEPVVDHTMDALIEQSLSEMQKANYYGSNCVFLHREDLRYLQQFMNAYPDSPQFAMTWVAEVVHDANEGPMVMDSDFFNFLMDNRKKFEDSFVIFMSDHGHRLSSIVWTKIGTLDNYNPMMIMSIPKALRTPENLAILKENSEKLQTHYDTRATFLDILKFQPASNFTDHKQKQMKGEKGNSFFRKYDGERSCSTLPIPFSYCICQYDQEDIDKNSQLSIDVGKSIIDAANKRLTEGNMTSKCNLWEFSQTESNIAFAPVNETGTMKVIAAARWPYTKARLTALVHRAADGTFSVGTIDRADKYGKRGDCARGKFEQICDCKENWSRWI